MQSPPHIIERTRNRTSRATIRNGAVLIRLARNLSADEESHHIQLLLQRMAKASIKEQMRSTIDPFEQLLSGESCGTIHLMNGQSVRFEIRAGVKAKANRVDDGWKLTIPMGMERRRLHHWLWKLLSVSAQAPTEALVRSMNEKTIRGSIASVTVRFMRTRWGSCSGSGKISIATPLLCTSPTILQYVILHELSHLRHPNHSREFWRTVSFHMPEYRERIQELRKFRLPN